MLVETRGEAKPGSYSNTCQGPLTKWSDHKGGYTNTYSQFLANSEFLMKIDFGSNMFFMVFT